MTIWAGQLVSVLGSRMTGFALSVWVYQQTGSVTKYSFVLLAMVLPEMLASPVAGALVDRWDRRWIMILSDSGSALCTLFMAVLLLTDSLQLWSLALLRAVASTCETFQGPAYAASVSLLVPKARLGQVNGLIQLGGALPRIGAPVLAGVLVAVMEIWSVLVIDFVTFLAALGTLLIVRIPKPAPPAEAKRAEDSVLVEVAAGWNYLKMRPGLLAILFFFFVNSFALGVFDVSAPILILSSASVTSMGTLLSVGGFGLVAGSLVMSIWGGPKRRIDGVLGFSLPFGLGIVLTGIYPSLLLLGVGVVLMTFSLPLIFGCSQALWQTKVPANLQGRVFALRGLVMSLATVLAFVMAGPLADRVLEPLLSVGGPLAGSIGRIVGVGPGRGIGLMLVVVGILPAAAAVAAYLAPSVRRVEEELPDAIPDQHENDFPLTDQDNHGEKS